MCKGNVYKVIKLVPYNTKWNEKYLKEKELLLNVLNKEVINIYHIGNTAIPNIYSKPIIDILIEVKDIKNIDNYIKPLEYLGYILKDEFNVQNKRFFIKGLRVRSHHIHIFETGDIEIERHINFRDYMITHPDEAKKYEALKKTLAIKFKYDIESYCSIRDSYIDEITEKATLWAQITNNRSL